jgi:hypothetical protein
MNFGVRNFIERKKKTKTLTFAFQPWKIVSNHFLHVLHRKKKVCHFNTKYLYGNNTRKLDLAGHPPR